MTMSDFVIQEIYKKYSIPLNLQEHMLRASAVSKIITDNWRGSEINQKRIITVMLLHDMGNVVKIKVDNSKDLLINNKDSSFWKNLQRKYIKKYGTDDHIITYNILSELGLNKEYLWLVINKIFINNEMIAASKNFELKICAYSDQVSGPTGILLLQERFDELRERYGNNPLASINHPRIEYLISSAFKIENQIDNKTSVELKKITNKQLNKEFEELKDYIISVRCKDFGV